MDNDLALKPELQVPVDTFAAWWSKQSTSLSGNDAVKEPLFHYTDAAGLRGIVTNETMWFTSIFHLNDPSELGYGIEMTNEILEARCGRSERVARFCKWMNHLLIKSGGEMFGFFVASFSRSGNDLGQWRAYADDARGVAICLNPSLFQIVDVASDLETHFIARVHYDRSHCIRRVSEAIDEAIRAFEAGATFISSPAEERSFGKELARQLAAPLLWYAATSKHEAYAHENETRLLAVNDIRKLAPFTETRVRGSSLVPYIPVPLRVRSPGALKKIILGPASRDFADDAVLALLRRHGLPTEIVEKSEIPYTSHRP